MYDLLVKNGHVVDALNGVDTVCDVAIAGGKVVEIGENLNASSALEVLDCEGKYVVSWAFNYTPNVDTWRAAVVAAMTQYSAGGSWDDVVTAFVQGWATQYANQ